VRAPWLLLLLLLLLHVVLQGDEYDRRLGAKSFDMKPAAAAAAARAGSSSEDEDEDEDEEESGDPLDIDSEDLVAGVEYDEGACLRCVLCDVFTACSSCMASCMTATRSVGCGVLQQFDLRVGCVGPACDISVCCLLLDPCLCLLHCIGSSVTINLLLFNRPQPQPPSFLPVPCFAASASASAFQQQQQQVAPKPWTWMTRHQKRREKRMTRMKKKMKTRMKVGLSTAIGRCYVMLLIVISCRPMLCI
jgi:hypothetical protein